MWGALLVGVAAVHAGRLDGVLLAGLALIPLVAFELVTGLPAATQTLQRVRRAAARVFEVMDAPAPVSRARRIRARAPAACPHSCACAACASATRARLARRSTGSTST